MKRAVMVVFDGYDKEYAYKTYDPDIKEGDTALVEVNGQLKLVSVRRIVSDPSASEFGKATKFLMSRIDMSWFDKGRSIEDEEKKLQARIKARYNALEEEAKWRLLAKDDPELASLISKLDGIRRDV